MRPVLRKAYFSLHSYFNVLLHSHKIGQQGSDTKSKAWPHFDLQNLHGRTRELIFLTSIHILWQGHTHTFIYVLKNKWIRLKNKWVSEWKRVGAEEIVVKSTCCPSKPRFPAPPGKLTTIYNSSCRVWCHPMASKCSGVQTYAQAKHLSI